MSAEAERPTKTDRGFMRFDPIVVDEGSALCAYESSSALGCFVWLAMEDAGELMSLHVGEAEALRLVRQIVYLLDHHHNAEPAPPVAAVRADQQGPTVDAVPPWADGDMPDTDTYLESELFVAGALSTLPPFTTFHPAWCLPLARQALDALGEWEPSDAVSPVAAPSGADQQEPAGRSDLIEELRLAWERCDTRSGEGTATVLAAVGHLFAAAAPSTPGAPEAPDDEDEPTDPLMRQRDREWAQWDGACHVEPFSSRACQKGTKGCVTAHPDAAPPPAVQGARPVENVYFDPDAAVDEQHADEIAAHRAAVQGARQVQVQASPDRDTLGRWVREAWVRWAERQDGPKPSWLVPWEDLGEFDREADRCIGEELRDRLAAVQGAPDLTELRELAWRLRRVHDRTDHAADRKLCAGVSEQAASAMEAAADRLAVQGAPGGWTCMLQRIEPACTKAEPHDDCEQAYILHQMPAAGAPGGES